MTTTDPYPVTGAWMPGDPLGQRRLFTFATDRRFALDSGVTLSDVTIAYETWGTLDADGANAVLLCHAWTGDSHAAGGMGRGHDDTGWWSAMVGPGKPIDTDRYFVVCANVLGGCQGSTGPASPNPADGRSYGSRFPVVTIRDMVRSQARLADHLGVLRWMAVIGGSMGGMQALEWAVMYPRRVRSLVAIATCMQATAQQIAWGGIGRQAIRLDPKWRNGDYYDAEPGDGPTTGLSIARQIAQVTFRSDNVFTDRFGRDFSGKTETGDVLGMWQQYEVERYLEHHGNKIVRRFDANSYLAIGKAMDLHDVARGRGSLDRAMARVQIPTMAVGIWSDMLYPAYQQQQIATVVQANGVPTEYLEIDSPHGHDAFLINGDQIAGPLDRFLGDVSKSVV
ncbi:homoserine O-acetyltransferase MetX [Ilumatobacter sp.]|uniref:homoserine O-acetyltransferase MetX n=1 Tax=Ilumatobacter sp. TaxID=1967498 RepID=UPI003C55AB63